MQPIYDFIAQAGRDIQPFFVWYAPMMPHQAHNPPARLLKKYEKVAPALPVAKYWGMVEWFDETVGSLLKYLDDEGLADTTMVVYLADNGWITDPKTGQYAPKSKLSQYDGGLRTPIMIRLPKRVQPLRSDRLALSIDIVPTLLTAVGKKPTPQMQGVNLLDPKAVKTRESIFGECFTHESKDLHDPAASLRWRWTIEGDWKLILPDPKNEPNSPVELYNLADDPHEERNLASEKTDRVAKMRRKIEAWWPAHE